MYLYRTANIICTVPGEAAAGARGADLTFTPARTWKIGTVSYTHLYDENPDDATLENNMRQAMQLIARMPTIMTYAYQVKRRHFDKKSMYFHPINPEHSTAQSILNAIRPDRFFTDEEAKLLDLCMILHAEHGGGSNSTFTARVLSSTGTDIYSTIAAAIGSLKGCLLYTSPPVHPGISHNIGSARPGTYMRSRYPWKGTSR